MWLREIIQDEGEELEQIQARLMTDLLYGEQEGTAFLHHVLDMSVKIIFCLFFSNVFLT